MLSILCKIGKTVFDLKKRVVKIDHGVKSALLPKEGDIVVGFVDMLSGNTVHYRFDQYFRFVCSSTHRYY